MDYYSMSIGYAIDILQFNIIPEAMFIIINQQSRIMILKQTQGYPLFVKGNHKLFERIKLTLTTIVSLPKQTPISVPFTPKFKQIASMLEPIIHLQIIDDPIAEQIIRGKYQLKPETFYIYFPSEFRVDEKVYKSLCKNYENILDQTPRNIKPYVQKYIIWQQGKGQHSIQFQKYKISQSLSQIASKLIQSKLVSLSNQIKQYQSQFPTPKSLLHIFLLKNKLACIYSYLQLNNYANDILSDVWSQLMNNFRCLMKLPPSIKNSQKLDFPQDIPKLPYIFPKTNDILGYFQLSNSTAYLRIVTHAFFNLFVFNLEINQHYEGLSKLKIFLDYILNNVLVLAKRPQWTKQQAKLFEISRNAWVVDVSLRCLQELQHYRTQQKQEQKIRVQQTNQIHVSICSMLRNSVERIGFVLYKFDNYSIFPKTMQKQLQLLNEKVKKIKQPWRDYKKSIQSINSQQKSKDDAVHKSASFYRRQQFKIQIPQQGPLGLKLRTLISNQFPPCEEISKILINFQTYTQIYLRIIKIMHESLKSSPYGRVAKSLKLTLERATIYLGDWQHHQQFQKEPYQFEKIWPQLSLLQRLYRMFFIFVKVLCEGQKKQDLLHILSIIIKDENLQQWRMPILNILKSIQEILEMKDFRCRLQTLQQLQLNNNLQITAIVKNKGIIEFLRQSKTVQIKTKQIMLEQGSKNYRLQNLKIEQFKKCQKCNTKCGIMCQESGDHYTLISANIKLQKQKEQAIFYVQQMTVTIQLQQNRQIILYFDVNSSISNEIFLINTPKLTNHQTLNLVHSECWTPFTFRLLDIQQSSILSRVSCKIESDIISTEEQHTSKMQISDILCLQIGPNKSYHKIEQALKIQLNKTSQQTKLTLFIKSEKPQIISRNSKRKIQNYATNQILEVQATFHSSKLNKQYTLKNKSKALLIKPLLSVQFYSVQTQEQFSITNLRDLPLNVQTAGLTDKQKQGDKTNICWLLQKDEILNVESRTIVISPASYSEMKTKLYLNDWFNSEQVLNQKNNTFRIWYKQAHAYRLMQPIPIQSQEVGYINIPELNVQEQHKQGRGYELIGKIQGEVSYMDKQNKKKQINVWLVPVEVRNIVLPEIWINGKRGIWINSIISNVV